MQRHLGSWRGQGTAPYLVETKRGGIAVYDACVRQKCLEGFWEFPVKSVNVSEEGVDFYCGLSYTAGGNITLGGIK